MKNASYPGLLSRGFTLIELMVVVAIVGILSAIATSSYQYVMAKGDRATAISDIIEITQALERYFSFNRTFSNDFSDISMANAAAFNINDAQGLYTYYIVLPRAAITPGTSTAEAIPTAQTNGLSYTVYAQPTARNRDKWAIAINDLGFKFYFPSALSLETDKKAKDGWP